MKQQKLSLFYLLTLFVISVPAFADNLLISDAQIRLLPPHLTNTAAYMQITNNGQQDIELTKVTSEIAQALTFHQSIIIEGVAQMQELDKLVIKSGQSISLTSGASHIMLFDLVRPLQLNETVVIKLTDHKNKTYTVNAVVKKLTNNEHSHHQHH